MPSNAQPLPGGLVGFKETPHNLYTHFDGVNNYSALNTDQVIIANSGVDIELDSDIIAAGKVIYIKNLHESEINIVGVNSSIEFTNTLTLKSLEAVTLVLTQYEFGYNFLILGRHQIAMPILDFFVEAGAAMESGDTELQDNRFFIAPSVYIDGILLTYQTTTDRRYVSFDGITKTITINNGGVNEGENVQIFT